MTDPTTSGDEARAELRSGSGNPVARKAASPELTPGWVGCPCVSSAPVSSTRTDPARTNPKAQR